MADQSPLARVGGADRPSRPRITSEKGVPPKTVGSVPKAASGLKTGGPSSVESKANKSPKTAAPPKPQSWD